MSSEFNRQNNLDFLRFAAATLVLFSHCYAISGRSAEEPFALLTRIEHGGGFAVSLFFVLSGYLITGSFLKSKSAFEYLGKRILRLFPALAVSTIICALVIGPIFTNISLNEYFSNPIFVNYWSNLYLKIQFNLPGVFLSNPYPNTINGSLWTLPIEFTMYLLVLIIGVLVGLRLKIVLLSIGFFWLFNFYLLEKFGETDAHFLHVMLVKEIFKLGGFFFSGGLLFLVRDIYRPSGLHAFLAVGVFAIALGTRYAEFVYALTFPVIVMFLAFVQVPMISQFGKFGDFSYGIYIYAFPIQQVVTYLHKGHLSVSKLFVTSFFLTLVLAIISWFAFEKPALKLKNGISQAVI